MKIKTWIRKKLNVNVTSKGIGIKLQNYPLKILVIYWVKLPEIQIFKKKEIK